MSVVKEGEEDVGIQIKARKSTDANGDANGVTNGVNGVTNGVNIELDIMALEKDANLV